MTLTLDAERPEPHVHLDNRSLFLSDGAHTVMFSLSLVLRQATLPLVEAVQLLGVVANSKPLLKMMSDVEEGLRRGEKL